MTRTSSKKGEPKSAPNFAGPLVLASADGESAKKLPGTAFKGNPRNTYNSTAKSIKDKELPVLPHERESISISRPTSSGVSVRHTSRPPPNFSVPRRDSSVVPKYRGSRPPSSRPTDTETSLVTTDREGRSRVRDDVDADVKVCCVPAEHKFSTDRTLTFT